jgi:hypothetical protein
MTKKPIPFSRELYEKGYKVLRRDNWEILGIFFEKERINTSILQVYKRPDGSLKTTWVNEMGKSYECESSEDLLLEAKTIDLWIGLEKYGYDSYACYSNAYTKEHGHLLPGEYKKIKITVDADTLEQAE